VTVNVGVIGTTTLVTAMPTLSFYGDSVDLTATVTPDSGTSTPSGFVEFFAGTTSVGSQPVDQGTGSGNAAILFADNIPLGDNISLTAVYSGDSNFLPITSTPVPITITLAPTVTSLAASPTSANPGDLVTLTATVTNVGVTLTPPGSADFYDGTTLIGSAPISQATAEAVFTTTTLASGQHSLTAAYPGSTAFQPSTSTAVTVDIS
jgi:hypothetical protein